MKRTSDSEHNEATQTSTEGNVKKKSKKTGGGDDAAKPGGKKAKALDNQSSGTVSEGSPKKKKGQSWEPVERTEILKTVVDQFKPDWTDLTKRINAHKLHDEARTVKATRMHWDQTLKKQILDLASK